MGALQDLDFKCSFAVEKDGRNANPATIATCFTRPSRRLCRAFGAPLRRLGCAFASPLVRLGCAKLTTTKGGNFSFFYLLGSAPLDS